MSSKLHRPAPSRYLQCITPQGTFDPPSDLIVDQVLDLSYSWLGDKEADLIADWLQTLKEPTLELLDLSHNAISAKGAAILLNSVSEWHTSTFVHKVDLSFCSIYTEEFDPVDLEVISQWWILGARTPLTHFELGQEYHPVSRPHIISPDNPPTNVIDNLKAKLDTHFRGELSKICPSGCCVNDLDQVINAIKEFTPADVALRMKSK